MTEKRGFWHLAEYANDLNWPNSEQVDKNIDQISSFRPVFQPIFLRSFELRSLASLSFQMPLVVRRSLY
jgi:hypothetical protein